MVCTTQLQKFDDRPLFKPGALFNLPLFRVASKQIFPRYKDNFRNKPIPNNTKFTIIKKYLKKNLFCFFQKIPFIY